MSLPLLPNSDVKTNNSDDCPEEGAAVTENEKEIQVPPKGEHVRVAEGSVSDVASSNINVAPTFAFGSRNVTKPVTI